MHPNPQIQQPAIQAATVPVKSNTQLYINTGLYSWTCIYCCETTHKQAGRGQAPGSSRTMFSCSLYLHLRDSWSNPAQARAREPATGVVDFMRKLRQAWHIFFPEQPADITPKEEGKHRLRMILVADRYVHVTPSPQTLCGPSVRLLRRAPFQSMHRSRSILAADRRRQHLDTIT